MRVSTNSTNQSTDQRHIFEDKASRAKDDHVGLAKTLEYVNFSNQAREG